MQWDNRWLSDLLSEKNFHLKGQVEVKKIDHSSPPKKVMATQFARIEDTLEKHLPAEELAEVRRILYGEETP